MMRAPCAAPSPTCMTSPLPAPMSLSYPVIGREALGRKSRKAMETSNKLPLLAHFARARRRWKHLHGTVLERFQEQHARQIVAYAAQHSPFYCSHWAGHPLQEWRTLPTVDKALMMEHFDTFNTRGIKGEEAMAVALEAERSRDFRPVLGSLTVGLSSGCSRHTRVFLPHPWEQTAWAGTIPARTLHQLPRHALVADF